MQLPPKRYLLNALAPWPFAQRCAKGKNIAHVIATRRSIHIRPFSAAFLPIISDQLFLLSWFVILRFNWHAFGSRSI